MIYAAYEQEPIGVDGEPEAVAEHVFCSPECRAKCPDIDHSTHCTLATAPMDGLLCEICNKPLDEPINRA